MPKYQVTGRVTFNFDIEVEADDEDSAEDMLDDISITQLEDSAPFGHDVDVLDVVLLPIGERKGT